uniref:Ovule protein n=1 Tax=Strongyloides stercoralis TaxID=6248 RepID=A0A0K0EPQ0_STRER
MWITRTESETCKLFSFGRNLFRINASYDKESRYYCCCFGGCCLTGTDSEALRLSWKKLEDVPILQLSRKHRSSSKGVRSCCSTGSFSGT